MAITLSVVDDGDDTGATATLAGGDTTATNIVYTQKFSGEIAIGGIAAAWTNSGTRVGNGVVSLSSLTTGHYFAWVHSDDTANGGGIEVSSVSYFTVTDGVEAVHYRIGEAVQSRIRALNLSGIEDNNVIFRKVQSDRGMTETRMPCVILSTMGIETQPPKDGTNIRDDIGYPIMCSIILKDESALQTNHETMLKWREKINRAFRNQRLPGVTEVIYANVQPAQTNDFPSWLAGKSHSSMILRFISREVRGI